MSTDSELRVLGIVASRRRDGRTQEIVRDALAGAAEAGAAVDSVFLADYELPLCRDCQPWVCRETHRCKLDEEGRLAALTELFLKADAVVFGTPVYYWTASELANVFIQRMLRTQADRARGVPGLGIGVAGGTGGGLVSGLRPIYHFFQMMGMRGIDPLPATRLNWAQARRTASRLGGELLRAARDRQPFVGLERLAWYDDLPDLNMSRVEERVLLAGLSVEAVAASSSPDAQASREAWKEAQRLLAQGQRDDALPYVDRAQSMGLKAFEAMGGTG